MGDQLVGSLQPAVLTAVLRDFIYKRHGGARDDIPRPTWPLETILEVIVMGENP